MLRILLATIVFLPIIWTQNLEVAKNVECRYNNMKVTFDLKAETLKPIFANGKKEADVYVKGQKDKTECKKNLRDDGDVNNQQFTIPIDKEKCGVEVIYLEPSFTSVQSSVVIQQKDGQFKVESLVYCLFKSLINGTLGGNKNGLSTIPPFQIDNNTVFGGAAGESPEPVLHFSIQKKPGETIEKAKLGDPLVFNLSLEGDNFNAIQPQLCEFSEEPSYSLKNGSRIRFVQDSCPLPHLTGIIQPMRRINPTTYLSNFTTFRFRNSTQLYLSCIIKLCVNLADCNKTCLNAPTTNRKKRSVGDGTKSVEMFRKLEVIGANDKPVSKEEERRQNQQLTTTTIDRVCMATSSYWGLMITLCAVVFFLLLCLLVIIGLLCRLRQWTHKSVDDDQAPMPMTPYSRGSMSSLYGDSVYSLPSVRIPRATPRI